MKGIRTRSAKRFRLIISRLTLTRPPFSLLRVSSSSMSGWRFTVCQLKKSSRVIKRAMRRSSGAWSHSVSAINSKRQQAENPALGIGTSPSAGSPADLPPPVMAMRPLDPKTQRYPMVVGRSDFCATGRSTKNDRAARRSHASPAGPERGRWRAVQDAAQ